jgi:hypothetical protein
MANMSYCRNENTYLDLVDCINNIHIVAGNIRDESYRKRVLSLIIDFVESGEAHEALEAVDNESEN